MLGMEVMDGSRWVAGALGLVACIVLILGLFAQFKYLISD